MSDALKGFWAALPATGQDLLLTLALLAPGLLVGVFVLRGYSPWGLVRAMLVRFAAVNAVFVALIAVSVAIGVGLVAQERGLRQGTARAAEKFDLIVAAPGSEITAMLASVYLQPSDVPLLSGQQFAEVGAAESVTLAAPIAFGDSFQGAPVVGTTAEFVQHLAGALSEGRMFETDVEAVAGAYAPVATGDSLTPAHGSGPGADHAAHDGEGYLVVGRMPPTGSPWDRAILVPIEGVWHVHGLATGHSPAEGERIGPPFDSDYFPGTPAILVRAETLGAYYALKSEFTRPDMMAFFPGTVLAGLHGLMSDVRAAMQIMAVLCQVLVTIAVLAGLMILARIFARSLALLRAIGAPARFVLAVVWSHAAGLIVIGAGSGLGLGFGAAAILSRIVTARTDVLVRAGLSWPEVHLVAGFTSIALCLALLPGLLAINRAVVPDLRS